MSWHEYDASRDLAAQDPPFYGIIMAAMRQADDDNLELLKGCWPDVFDELQARYNAPGGLLPGEEEADR